MARVNTFLTVTPTIDDSILGTDNTSPGSNSITRNFTLTDIYGLFAPLTLADIVTQSIASGNITKAPSSDAVYNVLLLKQGTITVTGNGSINQSTGVLTISTPSLQQVAAIGATTTTSLTANSFIKTGGSAAQILAANGTIITAGDNLILSAQGVLNATGGATVTGTQNLQSVTNYGASTTAIITAAKFVTTGGGSNSFVKGNGLLDTTTYAIASDVSSALALKANLSGATFTGNVTSTSFVRTGNVPGEILMSDGSIITQGNNITITGGVISSSGGGTTPTLSDVLGASGLLADGDYLLTDAGTKILTENLGGSQDLASVLANTAGVINGKISLSTAGGIAIRAYNTNGVAGEFEVTNGVDDIVDFKSSGVVKARISKDGELTATKIIKENGSPSEYLMADGNTTTLVSSGFEQNFLLMGA